MRLKEIFQELSIRKQKIKKKHQALTSGIVKGCLIAVLLGGAPAWSLKIGVPDDFVQMPNSAVTVGLKAGALEMGTKWQRVSSLINVNVDMNNDWSDDNSGKISYFRTTLSKLQEEKLNIQILVEYTADVATHDTAYESEWYTVLSDQTKLGPNHRDMTLFDYLNGCTIVTLGAGNPGQYVTNFNCPSLED